MNCGVCGAGMSRFERGKDGNGNTVYEYLCPKEREHAGIEARGAERKSAARKGKPSPNSGNPKGRGKR